MNKPYTIIALTFIVFSIILGAMASHSLKSIISSDLLLSFEKGVKYLLYSGLGLLVISLNAEKFQFKLKWVCFLITIGTLLFSGNIFLYIFHAQVPGLKNFVHLVPIGGTIMIIGWSGLLFQTIKQSK